MKIAVDLDGTISEYPEFFKLFCKAMREVGCRIYVVTDRPEGTEGPFEVSMEFTIPEHAPGTRFWAQPSIYWEVEARIERPGTGYHGRFLVPVYDPSDLRDRRPLCHASSAKR